ncbi:MAG: hypothetical protein M0Q26_07910 [Chitinophagaceae bacterium]|nr:hypothetical protein [Chitinophagaceae bacterium]
MTKMLKAVVVCCMVSISLTSFGQNVTGHWFGIGMVQNTKDHHAYLSEMVLRQEGKMVNGYLNYYFKDSLVKVALRGNFAAQTHQLTLLPFPIIYYQSPNARNSIDCYMSGSFILLASKTASQLNGSLFADEDHKYTVPAINLRLTKSNDTAFLVQQQEEPEEEKADTLLGTTPMVSAETNTSEMYNQRSKSVTKELLVENSTLKLELYDNGAIDYDSVSLFLNSKMILPKTMLTHRAIKLMISLDPGMESNELSMFAENLGMLPPNTAALILYDGTTRYKTMLTSDLHKTATLRLRKKKGSAK